MPKWSHPCRVGGRWLHASSQKSAFRPLSSRFCRRQAGRYRARLFVKPVTVLSWLLTVSRLDADSF
jgi:hypothetical protein